MAGVVSGYSSKNAKLLNNVCFARSNVSAAFLCRSTNVVPYYKMNRGLQAATALLFQRTLACPDISRVGHDLEWHTFTGVSAGSPRCLLIPVCLVQHLLSVTRRRVPVHAGGTWPISLESSTLRGSRLSCLLPEQLCTSEHRPLFRKGSCPSRGDSTGLATH